ncbi:MAG: triphosphoribosyl-dephospho-CoA synthase [Planctomycetota bacterium]
MSLVRQECRSPADAVRWCCILEATSPKPGNVYPGKDFSDLRFQDFVRASEFAAEAFGDLSLGFTHAVLKAAAMNSRQIGTNVNLGILLLVGPLAETDFRFSGRLTNGCWQKEVARLIDQCSAEDCHRVFEAIRISKPGGMGEVAEQDVFADPPDDLVGAMMLASDRDLIAGNYADGFATLFEGVVPILRESIECSDDLFGGIVHGHLRLLAEYPDSLILRKHGEDLAGEIQRRAAEAIENNLGRIELDRFLREHSLNPGTTADLIAASLYVLLREDH